MVRLFEEEELAKYLEALEVNPSDAMMLFAFLDVDGSGAIDVEEFCAGCLRLKGDATSFDMHCLIYECDRMMGKLKMIMERIDELFNLLQDVRVRRVESTCARSYESAIVTVTL